MLRRGHSQSTASRGRSRNSKNTKIWLEIAEARMGGSKNKEVSIANMMLPNATSVFQGLLRYTSHQKLVNDKWMETYLRFWHKHLRPGFPAPSSAVDSPVQVSLLC